MDRYVLVYQYGAAVSSLKKAPITTFRTTGMSTCLGIFAKNQKRSMLLHTTMDVQLEKIIDCLKRGLNLTENNSAKKIKFVIGSCIDRMDSSMPSYQTDLYSSFLEDFQNKVKELSTNIIIKEYKEVPLHGVFEIDIQGVNYVGKNPSQTAFSSKEELSGAIYDPLKRGMFLLQKYMSSMKQGYSALDLEIFYNNGYIQLDGVVNSIQKNSEPDYESEFITAVKSNNTKEFKKYLNFVKDLNCQIIEHSHEVNFNFFSMFSQPLNFRKTVRSPIHYAAYFGNLEMMQQLIDKKVDINILGSPFSKTGKPLPVELVTPLSLAAFLGHNWIMKLLLEHGADINKTDEDKDTPLHIAAYANNENGIKLLLSYLANIDAVNSGGDAPLHVAVRANAYAAVKTLLDLGANANSLTAMGNSAYALACQEGFEKIALLLQAYPLNFGELEIIHRP